MWLAFDVLRAGVYTPNAALPTRHMAPDTRQPLINDQDGSFTGGLLAMQLPL